MALTRATDKIIGNVDGNLNLSGIVTASRFSGPLVPSGDLNVGSNIKLGAASGIVTATSFSGDGSNLTSLPAGLGTALSSTQTSPLNKLYYTNEILSIGATVTVDHPATGTGAYTQYADLRLEEGADLIISDGDDVIPDILGLGTDGGGLGAGGTGRIRVDSITNKNANGAPTATNGLTVTGVCTATTFSGSGASLTNLPAGNLTGTLPAISGANLTSLPAQATIANNADNRVITGGSGVNLNAESGLTYNGQKFQVDTVTSETNAFRVYNTSTSATTYQINGEGDSFTGNVYPRSDGNLDLGYHSGYKWRDVVLSGGVRFGNANAANYLDDYEEGSFTPSLYYVSGTSGISYNFQEGRYTKIGRLVSIQIRLALTNKGSGNNNVRVGNLPFTPQAYGVSYDYFNLSAIVGCNLGSGKVPFVQMEDYGAGGRLTFYTFDYASNSNYNTLGNSQIDNNFNFGLTGTYVAA